MTTANTTTPIAACCETHDGPHVHGCVVATDHRGVCVTGGTEPEIVEDPLGHVEDVDYTLAAQLGLRHAHWSNDGSKGAHHGQRPCPTWCWVGQQEAYGHSVDSAAPWIATHTNDSTISVGMSLYRGSPRSSDDVISSATLEPRLEQRGQDAPGIRVAFRHYDHDGKQRYEHDHIRMTLDDTRDLIKALSYLVGIAEKG